MDPPSCPEMANETTEDNNSEDETKTIVPCSVIPEELNSFKRWHWRMIINIFNYLIPGKRLNEANIQIFTHDTVIADYAKLHMYPLHLSYQDEVQKQQINRALLVKKSTIASGHVVGNISELHNEVIFYEMYAKPNDNFPKCFYSTRHPITEPVIALGNVTLLRHYVNYSFTYNPPLEHTLSVMRELGRFHGKGYVMKERESEIFNRIVSLLKENRIIQLALLTPFISKVALQVINYVRLNNYDPTFCRKVNTVLSNLCEIIPDMMRFPDFLYTLCHGDLILSNILFKRGRYQQCKAMLIDFGFLTYVNPSFDIATYICLYCSDEERNNNFELILRCYHDGVQAYLSQYGIQNIDRYSYNAFLDDYKKNAIFGVIMAFYYLPVVMGVIQEIELKGMSIADLIKFVSYVDMDPMLKKMTNILQHLEYLDCLDLQL